MPLYLLLDLYICATTSPFSWVTLTEKHIDLFPKFLSICICRQKGRGRRVCGGVQATLWIEPLPFFFFCLERQVGTSLHSSYKY